MALRIADAPAVPVPDRPRAERASAALNGGDWSAVAALWAEANALEDHHERYVALRELAEAGFAAPRGSAAALARRFLATGRGLLAALAIEPREPVLLNYAGIALYEIGELNGAAALFEAAERLAPGETAAESNRREIDRRRSGRISVDKSVPPAVRAELGDLRRRATEAAAAARPATGMRLSLCMIVRDEEAHLGQCLASVQGVVDEMVIVDTGSTDRTKEIAESFGARVVDFPWTGSFSEARNVSFDAATGDWLIYLDADEVLVAEDREALRELTGRTWREAFHLVETSYVGALESGAGVNHNALRVFRNRPQYRFEGRIHEQILPTLPTKLPERFERSGVRLEHYGYLGVVRDAKRKADRNIELLERQAQEGVDDAFQSFNLGSEYHALGRDEDARRHLDKAWRMIVDDASGSHYPFAPVLVARLVRARRGVGDADGALRLVDEGLSRFPGFTDLVLEHARIAQDRGDDVTARERLEQCLLMGDAPSGYTATMGSGTFVAMFELAELLRRQGDLAGAEQLLRRSLREHPRFVQAVDPLAGVMLRRGASADAVVAAIGECVAEVTPGVRFILGMALYETGLPEDAEPHFRAVLERQPGSDLARVALAESLLSQRRWAEAREQAAAVPAGAACSEAARRVELFALLVAGDAAGARAALDAACGDVEAGDRGAFAAWIDACSGRAPVAGPEAAPALAITLEALLRVREVEAFATLVPALDRAVPSRRERHEVLADMYLRRGYLDSAADEWAAACEGDGPDAAALIGLAQVAVARGDIADAELFAQAAQEVDPADERAARLLDRLRARGELAPA